MQSFARANNDSFLARFNLARFFGQLFDLLSHKIQLLPSSLPTMTDLSGLNVLLKASSKQIVEKLINLAFISRNSTQDVWILRFALLSILSDHVHFSLYPVTRDALSRT